MSFEKYTKAMAMPVLLASYAAYRFPQEDIDTAPLLASSLQVSSVLGLFCLSYCLRKNQETDLVVTAAITSGISFICLTVMSTILVFGSEENFQEFKSTGTFNLIRNLYTFIPTAIYHILFATEFVNGIKDARTAVNTEDNHHPHHG